MTDRQGRAGPAASEAGVDEAALPAADGRIPGSRGRATRERLLAATAALLEAGAYRELSVVDIARRAGTSPATFYQYFPDVQSAILLLAQRMSEDGADLAAPLAAASWRGAGGYAAAASLADRFFTWWDEHRAVLGVVDLRIAEGDPRSRAIRNAMLRPVIDALAGAIEANGTDGAPDPTAQASVLVSMLAHVAEHQHGIAAWGVAHDDVRDTMARIVHWSVTGRKPPKA